MHPTISKSAFRDGMDISTKIHPWIFVETKNRQFMRYTIDNYHLKPPFASFLPGIAGRNGTPMWCFYVNRGQCVAAFGHSDKNHPILEFRPADQAYRETERLGFRTFIRLTDGRHWEPFGEGGGRRSLSIGCADIRLIDEWEGFRTTVRYASLPGNAYPALLRCLEIVNTSSRTWEMEVLDGLPRIVPCGIDDSMLKTMSTTAAAWIETTLLRPEIPAFRIRASIKDAVDVHPVKDCHFMAAVLCMDGMDTVLSPTVDPDAIFSSDLAFAAPRVFLDGGMTAISAARTALLGRYPAGFAGAALELKAGGTARFYSIYGYDRSDEAVLANAADWRSGEWFDARFEEYIRHVEECVTPFRMSSACPEIDAYTAQTALDNTLRGGMPFVWNKGERAYCYYVYSRKHGDLERDYNDFAFPAVRYSAGFGNYRDMNQNRRVDVCVNPGVGDMNIHLFMSLIQPDGYNPLIVNSGGFRLGTEDLEALKSAYPELSLADGELLRPGCLLDAGIPETDFPAILTRGEYVPEADFGEGYWTDHWTYNLDLIDQYLRVFPDREERLFFGEAAYCWYAAEGVRVRPLTERFRREGEDILPQSHLVETSHAACFLAVRSTLFEKLCVLAIIKCAALGYAERGLEMEAGRPGWCDALNGLPGLFGSSLVDSAELLRLLRLLRELARKTDENQPITLFRAAWQLMEELKKSASLAEGHERWLARWAARDAYRAALYKENTNGNGLNANPETEHRTMSAVLEFLQDQENRLSSALNSACRENRGIMPAYYRFEVEGWEELGNGYVLPTRLVCKKLPLYLEAAVKQMKLLDSLEAKTDLHVSVKCSSLYDSKLGMYVLNESLSNQPDSIGRAKAFPDGWLENGSVWLHMEYKYLLELLRAGDGRLFWTEARRLLIPFQNPDIYGRSPYENSSFIASSRYPVSACHGRGFVGRLSGATAEYLTMWSEFLLGLKPISMESEGPMFRPSPLLPAWLFREDGSLEFILFGSVKVRYENPERIDLYKNTWRIESMHLRMAEDEKSYGSFLPSEETNMLRAGKAAALRVVFRRK